MRAGTNVGAQRARGCVGVRSTRASAWRCTRRSDGNNPRATRRTRRGNAHRDVRVVADDVSGRGAQRAALAARLHECVLCEATRWRGACRHRLLVTMLFRTRRDSVAVCITPHYVNRRQPRAAGWAAWPPGAGHGWPAAGRIRSRAVVLFVSDCDATIQGRLQRSSAAGRYGLALNPSTGNPILH